MNSIVLQNIIKGVIKWYLLLFLFVVFVYFIGCAGQVEEKQENPNPEVIKPPPPPKSLAPGTAIIEARLLDLNEMENYYDCTVKVEKVLRYGMSTKPIGNGSELSLHISKTQNNLINLLVEGKSDQKYEFTIDQQPVVNMSSNQLRWRALKVNKLQNNK